MYKVAILQRILPDFRYDLFKLLSEVDNYSIEVFFGKGQKVGAAKNTSRNYSLFAKQIFTIPYLIKKYRVFHPTLIFHLLRYNPDIIITEPSTYFPNNFIAFLYAKIFGKKIVWWEAGLIDGKSSLRKIIEPFIRLMIKKSDSYICYSTLAKKRLIDEYRIKEEKIFIAQNTIYNNYEMRQDIEKRIKDELEIGESDLVLCYIGSVEKRKRIDLIIDAISIYDSSKSHLIIIGDGKELDYYKRYAEKLEKGQVHFVGRKEKIEANYYLAIADFTILPSEGGLAINHSLSVGTPVICGKNDGTEKDLIIDGFNGYIIQSFNPMELIKTLSGKRFKKSSIINHFNNNFSILKMKTNILGALNYKDF